MYIWLEMCIIKEIHLKTLTHELRNIHRVLWNKAILIIIQIKYIDFCE